jgi:hypothetical protein
MRKYTMVLPAAALLLAAACGGDNSSSQSTTTGLPTPSAIAPVVAASNTSAATTAKTSPYATKSFIMPLDLQVPGWLPPAPTFDESNFVTWEATDAVHAVRIMVPAIVYPPGSAVATPPPDDYLGYLLGQVDHGARFTDVVETTVAGKAATLMTAETDAGLENSIGCASADTVSPICFGLAPDLSLRIAVIDTGDQTLLIWLRRRAGENSTTSLDDSFTQMLASVRFSDRLPEAPAVSTAPAATPIDGIWSQTVTYEELKSSPLLYGPEEVIDGNWGQSTMTLDKGKGTLSLINARQSFSNTFTYEVAGDIMTWKVGAEHFVMRWRLEGDRLVFSRDTTIGIAPTPMIIEPWTRQS